MPLAGQPFQKSQKGAGSHGCSIFFFFFEYLKFIFSHPQKHNFVDHWLLIDVQLENKWLSEFGEVKFLSFNILVSFFKTHYCR